MARILVTGSSDGLGALAAQMLSRQGHQVVLHARNKQRAKDAMTAVPNAETCLIADLASIEETKQMAAEANKLGRFDAVIHNAGILSTASSPAWSPEGYALTFAVNSLAPYILTCLIERPARLVYMSSGLHRTGNATMDIDQITWKDRKWNGNRAYSDSKLHNIILANAVATRWGGNVRSNSVDPGWVPTRMGGNAPGNLQDGTETQVWLATSAEEAARVTGKYFREKKQQEPEPAALDEKVQEAYLKACEQLSGVGFPD